jgi:prepilin-type N-terminal cleavage/methylation domain-containing protein
MRRGAFTLLEMLAVIALMALLMTLLLPNFGSVRSAALRQEALTLATQLEFTRQQAVVAGAAHRLLIEVDTGGYRVERYGTDEADSTSPFVEADTLDLRGDSPIPMAPPTLREFNYRPISNRFGSNSWLGQDFHFAGVQTADGWLEEGDVAIVFDRDGSSDQVSIVIADDDENEIVLEVEPLLEIVRIRYGEE